MLVLLSLLLLEISPRILRFGLLLLLPLAFFILPLSLYFLYFELLLPLVLFNL